IAAEDVPRGGEDDELQDRVGCGEIVVVDGEPARGHEGDGGEQDDDDESPISHRPSNPEGLNASARSSVPNDTAGAHDGPRKVEVNDSARPRMNAPSNVPQIEPRPPRTQTANTSPMYSRPMEGCTG